MMNTITPQELATIKRDICSHFNLSEKKSSLTLRQKDNTALLGRNIYYDVSIQDGPVRRRVFGKLSRHARKEFQNLKYIQQRKWMSAIRIPRAIAVVEIVNGSLLLQEYLDGYSHILENRRVKHYLPGRIGVIENTGRSILEKIYRVQERFRVSYSPVSLNDMAGLPNQPTVTGVVYQLDTVHSLSKDTKKRLGTKLNSIVINDVPVRRGLIHGDLGMRNIMERNFDISFIDWCYMQKEGISVIDPCFFVVMLLMRSIQLLVSWEKVNYLASSLFQQVKLLEETMDACPNSEFIDSGIWFIKCLCLIDTLWWYEKAENNGWKDLVRQRGRQIDYLVYLLEREAMNENY